MLSREFSVASSRGAVNSYDSRLITLVASGFLMLLLRVCGDGNNQAEGGTFADITDKLDIGVEHVGQFVADGQAQAGPAATRMDTQGEGPAGRVAGSASDHGAVARVSRA